MINDLPPIGSINALFYVAGYLDYYRGKNKNYFNTEQGKKKISCDLWDRGHNDAKNEHEQRRLVKN